MLLKVGILGGGQLAMMLAEAAQGLGLETSVLAADVRDPAMRFAHRHQIGSLSDEAVLTRLFSGIIAAAYENEFVDADLIERCLARFPVSLNPAPAVMGRVADKLQQKDLFRQLGIPTAPWEEFNGLDAAAWMGEMARRFPAGFMLKAAKGGYDGKGNCAVFDLPGDLAKGCAFAGAASAKGVKVYAEERITFTRELAIVAVGLMGGEAAFFPMVISRQENAICSEVRGPAVSLGIPAAFEAAAQASCQALISALSLRGCIAMEFFLTPAGLLANEMAPRVHNTGHYSQHACAISQFEAHWRGLLGLTLPDLACRPFFGMINILGPAGYTGPLAAPALNHPAASLYWYHKAESMPYRKIGHVNLVAQSEQELESAMVDCRRQLANWQQAAARSQEGPLSGGGASGPNR